MAMSNIKQTSVSLTFSTRAIEVLHRLLSQGLTVADLMVEIDERIASNKLPDADDAAMERRALLSIISQVKGAVMPPATPRLDGKNAAR